MGQREYSAVAHYRRHGCGSMGISEGAPDGSWLAGSMVKKSRMLVAIALANKMARGIGAMLTKRENYRDPATVPA
ncbi:hypothetical protein [Mesorhizobium delmotii]|uniref:Transposase n=1 Tax=Mesorhizobium delmotii TaxID=1631247 RepID=A0A2P9AGQ6_9HYPH|nr:hypothetical protein [Mesorhizobium delmotii]SJM30294.1 hypothetical protein BQ8482_130193 [Mesorhizobium delmotii]